MSNLVTVISATCTCGLQFSTGESGPLRCRICAATAQDPNVQVVYRYLLYDKALPNALSIIVMDHMPSAQATLKRLKFVLQKYPGHVYIVEQQFGLKHGTASTSFGIPPAFRRITHEELEQQAKDFPVPPYVASFTHLAPPGLEPVPSAYISVVFNSSLKYSNSTE